MKPPYFLLIENAKQISKILVQFFIKSNSMGILNKWKKSQRQTDTWTAARIVSLSKSSANVKLASPEYLQGFNKHGKLRN